MGTGGEGQYVAESQRLIGKTPPWVVTREPEKSELRFFAVVKVKALKALDDEPGAE